jgi:hypothetical protein
MGMSTICHRLYVCWLSLATFFPFWWGHIGLACCHGIIYSYCIKKSNLRTTSSMKISTKSTTLSRLLNRLNLKTCQKLPPTFSHHKFLVLSQNLKFNHLSKSLGSPLPLWYFEFTQFSLGFRLKPQLSQVSSICTETGISATPSTFRDHYSWTVRCIGVC